QAAELSLRANRIYGSDLDRETAVRMLRWLVEQYPSSSLTPKAKQLLRQTRNTETTVASSRTSPGMKPPTPTLSTPTPTPASIRSAAVSDVSETLTAAGRDASSRPVLLKSVKRAAIDDLVRVTLEFDGEVAYTQDRIDGPPRLFFDMKRTMTTPTLRDATLTY